MIKKDAMTELQRQAVEHVERARSQGMTLSDYARSQGISARRIYDATAQLRRRGVLSRRTAAAGGKFVAVQVVAPIAASRGAVCRVLVPGGLLIECADWPPPAWLSAVQAERRDAAS